MNQKTLNVRRKKPPGSRLIAALCLTAVAGSICQKAAKPPCAMADERQANWKVGIASVAITPLSHRTAL